MKVVYCAGEQARVVLDILRRAGDEEDVILLDDDPKLWGKTVSGVEVAGGEDRFSELDPDRDRCVVAFGDERGTRLDIAGRVRAAGISLFSAVDVDATVAGTASIGNGVIVNAGTYIGPDAHAGDLVLVDSGVSVSHDVRLAEGTTVGPGVTISGGVSIGRDAYVGAGATVVDDIEVGERSVIGAGAVVVDDVASETTVIGIPAEPIE